MNNFFRISILSVIVLLSCSNNPSDAKKRNSIRVGSDETFVIIDIQPFSDIDNEFVNYVELKLKEIYPNIIVKESIQLPKKAYYPARNRYRADSLIRYLSRITANNHITIGITSKDISHTKGNIPDYGIMGLGFMPGNACVVSTFRISKTNTKDQLFKLAIHELGHTQGLDHCPELGCFMRDAKGENHIDEETDFCPKCKQYLKEKGWKFS